MPEASPKTSPSLLSAELSVDLVVIGGGLAGLALSIQMAKSGYSVVLLEKEKYPFHRVCGEYISMESWNFLESLGVDLSSMKLPKISKLTVSAPGGKKIQRPLSPGGFGISRYTLDATLAEIARSSGVELIEECRVTETSFDGNGFMVRAAQLQIYCRACACSFGKRSNLDVRWKRSFVQARPDKLNNYVGIKYHVRYPIADETIALHNFENGYCGISEIENGKSCLCYLTTAENLSRYGNDIEAMEKNLLSKNPHLKNIFSDCVHLYDKPETISQISFSKKEQLVDHMLMVGDAAGMITPLCGNGMSMALHSSKIASSVLHEFLNGRFGRSTMEEEYCRAWKKEFEARLATGRFVQSLFGRPVLTNMFISVMKPFPFLADMLIRQTHGKPF